MNRPPSPWRIALAAAALIAVSAASPAAAAPNAPDTPSAVVLGVQTYNMDFGADLQPLFSVSSPQEAIAAATAIWNEMVDSDIPARAQAVARQIVAEQPDLVGLQEVSIWASAPATFTPPQTFAPTGPFVVDYDALTLLLADLKALGTPYTVVTANTNFSNVPGPESIGPLPFLGTAGFRLATFTDRDVTLVRSSALSRGRISLGEARKHTYTTKLPVSVAGNAIAVPRGWTDVDVTVRGRTIRFANTHLEAYGANFPGSLKDQIRNPQSVELAAALEASPYPVVLVGDINARPTMCNGLRTTPPNDFLDQNVVAYENLTNAGLLEVWPLVYPGAPCGSSGWTSGQSALDNTVSTLDHRIDDVFLSAGFTALEADVVGDRPADRTPSGLWPSDHASTWAKVRLDNAQRS
jgi:endonuclease/exonuclease/phosphatase family metal-dependent hydrolase